MYYLDHPFNVRTLTSRRPTPTHYVHLRKYAALVKQYLRLRSQTDIVNVNDVLNLVGNLYVSNEISRVIAQLIGVTDKGWETIKATEDGELKVYPSGGVLPGFMDVKVADGDDAVLGTIADDVVDAGAAGTLSAKLRRATQGLEDLKTLVVLAAGTNLIGKVDIAGSGQTCLFKKIDKTGIATHDIITAVSDKKHHITTIVFTVGGATNIILRDSTQVFTGKMDFGDVGQPAGMVANHGINPLICATNSIFQIDSDANVQISGYVLYYDA